jgi:hypothetical protein
VKVTVGNLIVRFSGTNGTLSDISYNGKTVSLKNGPVFIAARRGDRTPDGSINPEAPKGVDRVYLKIPESSALTRLTVRLDGQDAEINATYSGTFRKITWRVTPDEELCLDYEYQFDGVVDLMGLYFDYPETQMQSIRWLGRGPFRVWQNRMQGTRLDVWENNYNDPVPGETFVYPEFKGWFSDWEWASFQTTEGVIQMKNGTPGSFLGVYAPRDGRDALLYTFPETGLGLFRVIPPVRNKVNTTDLIGPSSQAQRVSGIQKGSVSFRFQ